MCRKSSEQLRVPKLDFIEPDPAAGVVDAIGERFDIGAQTGLAFMGGIVQLGFSRGALLPDRAHQVRVIAGNGLRPEIWDEFTKRFGIARVCEFYASSEGNAAFINIFNVPGPPASRRRRWPTWSTTRIPAPRCATTADGCAGCLPVSPACCSARSTGCSRSTATPTRRRAEKKLVRNAFREGDCWFNSGDVMSPQGMGHAAFVDRLGDTFRWKGENVATTQVEAALASDKAVEECTVFGVEIPHTGGRAGMAAIKLRDGAEFDGKSLARAVYEPAARLRTAAVRAGGGVDRSRPRHSRAARCELREQAYGADVKDPLYVLAGRDEGYLPYYDEYPDEVAAGKRPQG